jgi:8-oxo-dGTP pyrophosphatase MutT (NUDIX family)
LLRDHGATPSEQAALRAMVDLAATASPVTSPDHLEPGHFTASAFVTDPSISVVLLVLHAKLGMWVQPGGHIERHDPGPLAAAVREVAEETGVVAQAFDAGGALFDVDVHRIPARGVVAAHLHHDLRFHLVGGRGGEHVGDSGVLDVRWVPLDDVASLTVEESVLRPVEKLRRWPRGDVSGVGQRR